MSSITIKYNNGGNVQYTNNAYLIANELWESNSSSDRSIEDAKRNWVDNSQQKYVPFRLRCGVEVQVRPDVLVRCPLVLQDLNEDLQQCLQILPRSVHNLIRRTRVWVNSSYCYGPRSSPVFLNHSTAHHHEAWLLWAKDRPDKALGIEIYNCFDYRRMRLHWNGCGLIMHELCHLVHQLVLPDGLENATVKEAFKRSTMLSSYKRTLRRDWAGKNIDYDVAYAMVDHKEYFAEMSVSYWSQGYSSLDHADSTRMECCSPPILEPRVLARLYHNKLKQKGSEGWDRLFSEYVGNRDESTFALHPLRFLAPLFRRWSKAPAHCNKFYPFTRGQLQNHDPGCYRAIEQLWEEIATWEDTVSRKRDCVCLCLKPLKHLEGPSAVQFVDTVDL